MINKASSELTRLFGCTVELKLVQPFISGLGYEVPKPGQLYEDILVNNTVRLVCDEFGITYTELRLRRQTRERVDARKMIAYLLNKYAPKMTDKTIANVICRDRTTVYYSIDRAADLIETHKGFKLAYDKINAKLEAIIEGDKIEI